MNKTFISKVMFLVAVSQPRKDHGRKVLFDGKLGCWTLTEVSPFSRNIKNRTKGTMVVKEITSVDKTLIKNILIRELLPAIVEKFPKDCKEINIQLDNSSPHIKDDDVYWRSSVEKSRIKVKIKHHPSNSPDTNVLDIGYFNAIQYFHQKCSST